jgi:predicted PurR-regulated permease PerM
LRHEIFRVWNAFLRGQLLLGSAMAVVTAVVDTAIGLPYAWALGLLAGVMELVPNIGPFLAGIPAVLIALIQGSSFIPLGNFWFAVLVAGLYTILQLIENNFFVPRILGRTLNLHPLAVLIAILAGGQLGGILGVLLAAPTLATFRVLGRYVLCRLYDRDPFAPVIAEEEETPRPKSSVMKKVGEAALQRLQEKVKLAAKQYAEHSDPPGASGP